MPVDAKALRKITPLIISGDMELFIEQEDLEIIELTEELKKYE